MRCCGIGIDEGEMLRIGGVHEVETASYISSLPSGARDVRLTSMLDPIYVS